MIESSCHFSLNSILKSNEAIHAVIKVSYHCKILLFLILKCLIHISMSSLSPLMYANYWLTLDLYF